MCGLYAQFQDARQHTAKSQKQIVYTLHKLVTYISSFRRLKELLMRGVIKKWGNSAAVRLPSSMMKTLKLDLEDVVDLKIEHGAIVIEPLRTDEYVLGQLLAGIKSKNVHAEIDFGAAGA